MIADPGYRLVTHAIRNGIAVTPIPGPSAALAALACSGLPTDRFRFLGFLPHKDGARRKLFQSLLEEDCTLIAYESPHRILHCLEDIDEIFCDRPLVLARELTKLHEEFLRGTASTVHAHLSERPAIKGEFTLLIGRGEMRAEDIDPVAEIDRLQQEDHLDRMTAIKTVAKRLGLPKREVYRLVAEAPGNNPPGTRRD